MVDLSELARKKDLFIDNAATASQNETLIDDGVTREAIELNIIAPLIVEISERDQRIAALDAQLAERVKVNPLEWVDGRNCECSAETVVGMYEVGFDDGWWAQLEGGVTWDWEPDQDPRSYEGPGAAKAAAQADFERRIRSTLSPAPQEAEAEPFGYWCKHRLSDGVLLKKPAYIPDASADQTVIPLYTHPPAPAVTEAMVETVGEHLFSMGHTGINKRDLRAALQAAQKVKP